MDRLAPRHAVSDPAQAGVSDPEVVMVSKPFRTCVGCRTRCRDVELLRVVVADQVLTPDPRRRLPGRGAWIHPDKGCVAIAEKRRAFDRAFTSASRLDVTPIGRYVDSFANAGDRRASVVADDNAAER